MRANGRKEFTKPNYLNLRDDTSDEYNTAQSKEGLSRGRNFLVAATALGPIVEVNLYVFTGNSQFKVMVKVRNPMHATWK